VRRPIVLCLFVIVVTVACCSSRPLPLQEDPPTGCRPVAHRQVRHPLYPNLLDDPPDVPSPYLAEDGREIVTALLKSAKYALMPVTVENGGPLHYSRRVPSVCGKDQQLYVNRGDFPTLAATGLHADAELDGKGEITGIPVDVITYIGRPARFSGAGFLADDEDILSVLKGDNDLVRTLGLTHPQMAKPLYHVWNLILQEIESGKLGRFSSIEHFLYNGREIAFRAEGMKGWQVSIFQDEIQGRFDIDVRRMLTAEERRFLRDQYPRLSDRQMAELEERLTHVHFSEMAPYYIMGYGFYEGHTTYRADPIAIACIFGLKTVEEIEGAFPGDLYGVLSRHFTDETVAG
jgi:hypothetical protein